MKNNVISLFSGVGGIDLGFERAGFNTIWKNEMDKYAVETLRANNINDSAINSLDILKVPNEDIPNHNVLVAGFPCQPFSLAGNKKSFDDPRGKLIFRVLEIIDLKKPEVVFLENVKNLVSINSGKDMERILNELSERGYYVTWKILNTSEYTGIPQNRERLFIVAFKSKSKFNKFNWPVKAKKLKQISDVVLSFDDRYIYNEKYARVYKELKNIDDENLQTAYQWRRHYIRANKNNIFPTLTANMGTGGHNVPLIKQNDKWRKITPREAFILQGYPKNFILPEMADSHLYKQAGNSVTVPLIEKIAKEIMKTFN